MRARSFLDLFSFGRRPNLKTVRPRIAHLIPLDLRRFLFAPRPYLPMLNMRFPRRLDCNGGSLRLLNSLLKSGIVQPMVEPAVPKVPMDYTWAKRLGLVRKPANFISSISDDRGDELRSVSRLQKKNFGGNQKVPSRASWYFFRLAFLSSVICTGSLERERW